MENIEILDENSKKSPLFVSGDEAVVERGYDKLNDLIVTELPSDFFFDDDKKRDFERIFKSYEASAVITYFRVLKRCKVVFQNELNAIQAQLDLNNCIFDSHQIRVYFAQVGIIVSVQYTHSLVLKK